MDRSSTKVDLLKKKLEAVRSEHIKTERKRKFSDMESTPEEDTIASNFPKVESKDINSTSFSSVLFVEIFSGTAGLTCSVRKLGFQGIGIDFGVSKACKSPVIRLGGASGTAMRDLQQGPRDKTSSGAKPEATQEHHSSRRHSWPSR